MSIPGLKTEFEQLKEFEMLITKKQPPEKSKSSARETSEVSGSKGLQEKKTEKTRITIHYDVGFNNHVYLRGHGAGLSWEKGIKLKNVKPDEWMWETDLPFNHCEFKVLINDQCYEAGENHQIKGGNSIKYTPKFS